jgi:RNA polymerase sigma factor (TIGR02999 family)
LSLEGLVQRLPSPDVSELLQKWQSGDQEALQALVPLVYQELHRLAHHYLRGQRPNHTLQSTALVHEAYLRLSRQNPAHFADRNHFFAVAALCMRQILVEYARSRRAVKRDAGYRLTLDDSMSLLKGRSAELVALDEALKDLARLDPQQSQIVELRFFGGLSIEETAQVLSISPATVKRHWTTARVWLHREMSRVGQT